MTGDKDLHSYTPIHINVAKNGTAAAAAKSLQSCPTLCDPRDSSPPGCPVPGILQARTLEWVAISFSNAWRKWSCSVVSDPQQPHGLQPSRLFHPWDFPGRSTGVGCHCLLREWHWKSTNCFQRRLYLCSIVNVFICTCISVFPLKTFGGGNRFSSRTEI